MSTRIYVGVAVLVVVAVIAAAIALTRPDSVQPMPSKDNPAAYTVASVEDAIQRYERDGREATVAYYNNAASVNGQWYVFIVDDGGITIAHHNSKFRGRDPSERVDVTGYFYGDELLGATEEGPLDQLRHREPGNGRERAEAYVGDAPRRAAVCFRLVRVAGGAGAGVFRLNPASSQALLRTPEGRRTSGPSCPGRRCRSSAGPPSPRRRQPVQCLSR